MIQRRNKNAKLDFNRGWASYKYGFGKYGPTNEMWLGTETLHKLTQLSPHGVHVRFVLTSPRTKNIGVVDYVGFKVGLGVRVRACVSE